jgi:hypothetical protein
LRRNETISRSRDAAEPCNAVVAVVGKMPKLETGSSRDLGFRVPREKAIRDQLVKRRLDRTLAAVQVVG